ncbi:hypothetical protein CLAIMM_12091 [Cladophialophora immunda]|nr:hypothetical protein CLAIMM_12091 [Cladophialophora immunda]
MLARLASRGSHDEMQVVSETDNVGEKVMGVMGEMEMLTYSNSMVGLVSECEAVLTAGETPPEMAAGISAGPKALPELTVIAAVTFIMKVGLVADQRASLVFPRTAVGWEINTTKANST